MRVQAVHDEGAPTPRIPVLEEANPRRIAITMLAAAGHRVVVIDDDFGQSSRTGLPLAG